MRTGPSTPSEPRRRFEAIPVPTREQARIAPSPSSCPMVIRAEAESMKASSARVSGAGCLLRLGGLDSNAVTAA